MRRDRVRSANDPSLHDARGRALLLFVVLRRWVAAGCLGLGALAARSAIALPFDANCDLRVDEADVAAAIAIVFGGPNDCETADANSDGRVSVADVAGIIINLRDSPVTPSPIETITRTPGPPGTPTRTATISRTPSRTRTPTRTRTPLRTPTITRTVPATRTPTVTPTASRTRTATNTRTATRTRTSTRTFTITPTFTPTRTRTATRTPSRTRTATPTPTITPTATITRTPTPTLPPSAGPRITYFGLITAFNTELKTTITDDFGRPVFLRQVGAGFFIVVEVRPGTSGRSPGRSTFNSNPDDPSARPDLQILASRDLGNGSPEICDTAPPRGGVPGVNPPEFDPTSQTVADALNDLGCRFEFHTSEDPCTIDESENFAFLRGESTLQFCTRTVLGAELHFPPGDTTLVVQVRDDRGNLGFPESIVVRVP